MESSFAAFRIKRHMKHSGNLTMVCAELTNPDSNLETDSKDLAIIGRRWFLILSSTPGDITLVRSMVTSYIKH